MKKKMLTTIIIICIIALIAAAVLLIMDSRKKAIMHVGDGKVGSSDLLEDYFSAYKKLIWSDEFDGTSLDMSKWVFEGSKTHRNNELQCYADSDEDGNVTVKDGILTITGRKEDRGGMKYTSASIMTMGKATFKYGRYEMKAKLPSLTGSWPAFWMMGQNPNIPPELKIHDWPRTGEIDIMESISAADANKKIYATLHVRKEGTLNEVESKGGNFKLDRGEFCDDYHVFGLIHTENELVWYVDDEIYFRIDITDEKYNACRDYAFYFLLNLAVGGNWPGAPAPGKYEDTYKIDYVRVYQ